LKEIIDLVRKEHIVEEMDAKAKQEPTPPPPTKNI